MSAPSCDRCGCDMPESAVEISDEATVFCDQCSDEFDDDGDHGPEDMEAQ